MKKGVDDAMNNRPATRVPSYRLHKGSGQARVTINGRDRYLGVYGTPESKEAYRRLIAEHLGRPPSTLADALHDGVNAGTEISVEELLAAFLEDAQVRYVDAKTGRASKELAALKVVMRHLRRMFADFPAHKFGPLKLRQLQRALIEEGLARKTINQHVKRAVRIFKWGASQELLPASVWHALQTVEGVKEKEARTATRKVEPVPMLHVEAVLQHVSRQVGAVIQLQLLTGARPGEILSMRPHDVEQDGPHGCWTYRPASHKTEHHGHERVIFVGPKGQAVLEPFLDRDEGDFCFSPAEAERDRNEEKSAARTVKLHRGYDPRKRRKPRPKRKPQDRYSVDSYRRAIERGVCAANAALVREVVARAMVDEAGRESVRDRVERVPVKSLVDRTGDVVLDDVLVSRLLVEAGVDRLRAKVVAAEVVKAAKKVETIEPWSPHQLRHSAATDLRREFGVETAQVTLGHRNVSITEVYAEKNLDAVARAIAKVG